MKGDFLTAFLTVVVGALVAMIVYDLVISGIVKPSTTPSGK